MPGNTFGLFFRLTTAGESHGPANIAILDGVPPGLALSEADLQPDLDRRRPGQSKVTTQRDEADRARILSGVFDGRTTGTSIALMIENADQRSRDYSDIKDKYRPGHADYTFDAKYGFRDYRGGGRASARETNVRVAAGAIAKKLLAEWYGVRIVGYVRQIGNLIAAVDDPAAVTLEQVEASIVRCPDPAISEQMIELVQRMRNERDSIGGVAEIIATGVPAGWGEPVFDKLKADLGKAMFTLPAVVGVEYGAGFNVATMRGSEHNDYFTPADEADQHTDAPDGPPPHRPGDDATEPPDLRNTPGSTPRPGAGENAEPSGSGRAASAPRGHRSPSAGASHGGTPRIITETNRHGGMLGGISSGMPIVLRCAVKPTSSLPQDQPTVTTEGAPTKIATRGRHDPCLLPRFIPMAEAMMALTLADHALRQRAVRGE